ncbi:MAG TPA: PQQ-dependent sugar dehydrogenase [Nocardioidaceae bacterium]|jgi:glucose/arabinose dehydrogenase
MNPLGRSSARAALSVVAAAAISLAALEAPPSAAGLRASVDSGVPSATGASALAGVAGHHQRKRLPALRTHVVMPHLDIPWDISVMPSGAWLVTERDRQRILLHLPGGGRRVLSNGPAGIWSSGETGLMSIVHDPRVARNNRFYTCNGWERNGHHDIRVLAWRLNRGRTHARIVDTLVSGIQITSGRHGGCRLRFDRAGALWVGTGDSTVGTNPQNLHSLNGKLLRLNRFSGRPWPTNPWVHAPNRHKRFIFNYGHRNVQGLAVRPGGGIWSVEHGTDRDDEVNRGARGGNFGWNPVPGYDESTPMTDFSLPGRQIGARWRSGFPTLATSGAVWVRGKKWGRYNGTLAVCALKASELLFMKFDRHGRFRWMRTPPAMRGRYGRLRSVALTHNHDLLVTTSNGGGGSGGDRVIRVSPR